MSKIQPLDKTIVTELKVQVADIHTRLKHLQASIAAKVPRTSQFTVSDATVVSGNEILINNITAAIIVSAFDSFQLDISNSSGQIVNMECTGLFIYYGQLDSVVIKVQPGKEVRLSYIYV